MVADSLAMHDPTSPPWDAVIHLGLEVSSKGLRIEVAAANVRAIERGAPGSGRWSAEIPCNKTGSPYEEIHPAAPCLLATTTPLDRILMDDGPIPPTPVELWSRDAGSFFCNEAYYRTLHTIRSQRLRPARRDVGRPTHELLPAVFIHLPSPHIAGVPVSIAFVRQVGAAMVGVPLPPSALAQDDGKNLGAHTDEHGCRPSAGYLWCAATS